MGQTCSSNGKLQIWMAFKLIGMWNINVKPIGSFAGLWAGKDLVYEYKDDALMFW